MTKKNKKKKTNKQTGKADFASKHAINMKTKRFIH